jgi:hypothetical protein
VPKLGLRPADIAVSDVPKRREVVVVGPAAIGLRRAPLVLQESITIADGPAVPIGGLEAVAVTKAALGLRPAFLGLADASKPIPGASWAWNDSLTWPGVWAG